MTEDLKRPASITVQGKPPSPFSPSLKEPETAKYINYSRSFLRRARMEGQVGNRTPGPPFVKIGKSVRYLISDLDQWLAQHRRES